MLIFLLLIPLILLYLIFRQKALCRRGSILSAAIVWGLLLTAITEFLSLFRLLTSGWLLGSWVVVSAILSAIFCSLSQKKAQPIAQLGTSERPLSSLSISFLLFISFVVAATGLIALTAPPNNADSMLYHMSRVVHWIQNCSVAHYPTSNDHHLYMPPWSEFAIAHLQILSGGDRFANLVQWCSMVGCLLGVSLIARRLGADAPGQIFAALAAATIPMGILQASSTQNDYVVSFWLVGLVYYLLLLKTQSSWTYALLAGGSLGLALLTKAIAYIYALPFLIWFGLSGLKTLRQRVFQPALVIGIVALLVNIGHYARNYSVYGHPISYHQQSLELSINNIFSVPTFISCVVRDISLHTANPIGRVNDVTEKGVRFFHRLLGVDVNDPRITSPGGYPYTIQELQLNYEDTAGNFVHLVLIIASIVIFLLSRRKSRELLSYAIAIMAAFLLSSFYLKWNPFNSRYHLPLFVLWSPFIAAALAVVPNSKVIKAIALILILLALPYVFFNRTRPLISQSKFEDFGTTGSIFTTSRVDQYFVNSPSAKDPYIRVTDFLKSQNCSDIGLTLTYNQQFEYPLWVLLHGDKNKKFRIEHVNVKGPSAAKYATPHFSNFRPCAIVPLNSERLIKVVTGEGVFAPGELSPIIEQKLREPPRTF